MSRASRFKVYVADEMIEEVFNYLTKKGYECTNSGGRICRECPVIGMTVDIYDQKFFVWNDFSGYYPTEPWDADILGFNSLHSRQTISFPLLKKLINLDKERKRRSLYGHL